MFNMHVEKAIKILIVDPENIRSRLAESGKHFITLPIEVVPEHLKDQFKDICEYLTKYKANPNAPYPYNSDVFITMKRRRASTACETADKIWSFYYQFKVAIDNGCH